MRAVYGCKLGGFVAGNPHMNQYPSLYHVPGGFAVGAGPVRRPGEAPREGVSSKNGGGWGGRNARDRCTGTGGWVV